MTKTKLKMSMNQSIDLDEKTNIILIKNLKINDPEGMKQLLPLSNVERENAIINAIKIGLQLIRNFQTTQEVNVIEETFKRFGETVESLTEDLSKEMQGYFGDKGVLSTLFDIKKKGSFPNTLSDSLAGPSGSIHKLLDPGIEGSPIFHLRRELLEEVKNLRDKIAEYTGKDQERAVSTKKGFDFEDVVFEALEPFAKAYGDNLEMIGKKTGTRGRALAGDLVVDIHDSSLTLTPRVVIEAKSVKDQSLPKLKKQMEAALENRSADWAIGVVESSNALPKSVGCFRFYNPNLIICAFEEDGLALEVAYQFARTNILLNAYRKESVKVLKAEYVIERLDEIEANISKIKEMKSGLTEINKTSNKVKTLLDDLRTNIRSSLKDLTGYIAECES